MSTTHVRTPHRPPLRLRHVTKLFLAVLLVLVTAGIVSRDPAVGGRISSRSGGILLRTDNTVSSIDADRGIVQYRTQLPPGTEGNDLETFGSRHVADRTDGRLYHVDASGEVPTAADRGHFRREQEPDAIGEFLVLECAPQELRVTTNGGAVRDTRRFTTRLSNCVVDADHTIWVADLGAGDVLSIPVNSKGVMGDEARHSVADAGDNDLFMVLHNGKAAVVDGLAHRLIRVGSDGEHVPLPSDYGRPRLNEHSWGPLVPIVYGDRTVVTVDAKGKAKILGEVRGHAIDDVRIAGDVVVVAPSDGRSVHYVTTDGQYTGATDVGEGPVELKQADEDHVFINNAKSPTAYIVGTDGIPTRINKDDPRAPTNKKPVKKPLPPAPVPSTVPPAPVRPAPDRTGPPQRPPRVPEVPLAPRSVRATPGDGEVHLAWDVANGRGLPITGYTISWRPLTGSSQPPVLSPGAARGETVTGLANGTTYVFTVAATNAAGTGASATSPPVTPTGEVPLPPATVSATARADGTVDVSWAAADGRGRPVQSYNVLADAGSGPQQVATGLTGLSARLGEGDGITLGRQHFFQVVAVNDRGAASPPSARSNPVVPRRPPLAVTALSGRMTARTEVTLTWRCDATCANGTAVERFHLTVSPAPASPPPATVDAASGQVDHSVVVGGLVPGTTYQFTVAAENEAGRGTPASAEVSTNQQATIDLTGVSVNDLSVTVSFRVTANGSTLRRCGATIEGHGEAEGDCGRGTATVPAPRWASGYRVHAWVETEFGRQDSSSGDASTPGRPTSLTDNGVPFVRDPDQGCGGSATPSNPCPNRVGNYHNQPYTFRATCQHRGAGYWRAGDSDRDGYAYVWVRRDDGLWAPNYWVDTANSKADGVDPSLPQC